MSWHHEDWTTFLTLLATGLSTFAAVKSAKTANAALAFQENEINNEVFRNIKETILLLAERANSCIADDAHIFHKRAMVIEFSNAIVTAKNLLDKADLNLDKKNEVTYIFKELLRPGVLGELEDLSAFENVGGQYYEGIEGNYVISRKFLQVNNQKKFPPNNTKKIQTT